MNFKNRSKAWTDWIFTLTILTATFCGLCIIGKSMYAFLSWLMVLFCGV